MSRVRDLQPVSGSICWARQIKRQLDMYMQRVEDVLGKDWKQHVDVQKLIEEVNFFRLQLNTTKLFDDWVREVRFHPFPQLLCPAISKCLRIGCCAFACGVSLLWNYYIFFQSFYFLQNL